MKDQLACVSWNENSDRGGLSRWRIDVSPSLWIWETGKDFLTACCLTPLAPSLNFHVPSRSEDVKFLVSERGNKFNARVQPFYHQGKMTNQCDGWMDLLGTGKKRKKKTIDTSPFDFCQLSYMMAISPYKSLWLHCAKENTESQNWIKMRKSWSCA